MTSTKNTSPIDSKSGLPSADELRDAVIDHITRKRDQIIHEIRNYPPPIPACDQQFNFLLSERGRISQLLSQLEASREGNPTAKELVEMIWQLVAASGDIDPQLQGKIEDLR